jgi:hypothetical protein
MGPSYLLNHPFPFHLNKRIQFLKDESPALASLDTGRDFFLKTEVTFGDPFSLLIIAKSAVRAT